MRAFRVFVFAATLSACLPAVARAQEAAQVEPVATPVEYGVTADKIADVKINEESPGRFIAVIQLVAAEQKALAQLTSKHVGEDLQISIEGERVLRVPIRAEMREFSIGPWMNEGLAKLFARCIKGCGVKKCL